MKHAFMLAATGSGCGKTTITCALLAAYKNQGIRVRSYKCGPDYIDPLFHQNIIGVPSRNLDLFFTGEEKTRELFCLENDSDLSIVEGVMGLYDGIDSVSDKGSSYHLARALDIPLVLVVDAHGMGRSLVAVIKGFLSMDYDHRIKGVLLNRISPMYFDTIRPVIEKETGLRVYGYYPKEKTPPFESRYLGLKLPQEVENLKEKVDRAAKTAGKTIDLEGLLDLGRTGAKPVVPAPKKQEKRVRIAVAKDQAFCFYYEDNLRLLEEAGAELVFFSPLADQKLPEDIHGLLLGGGYPELHAKELAENEAMRRQIRDVILQDMPSLAECGGFMYLHDSIGVQEVDYPMVGALKGSCLDTGKLVRFGYQTLQANTEIKGHEFHYYDSTNSGEDALCIRPNGRSFRAGHIDESHWWGYAHLYYPSNEDFVRDFVEKCVKWRKQRG